MTRTNFVPCACGEMEWDAIALQWRCVNGGCRAEIAPPVRAPVALLNEGARETALELLAATRRP